MSGSLKLGSVFGIPLRVHYTWLVIFVLISMSLSFYYVPCDCSLWQRLVGGVVTSLLFFSSVIAHELAHSVVAIRNGIPVDSVTLFIFGGVARISQELQHPMTEVVMAIAGPLCSIVLGGIFGAVWFLLRGIDQVAYLALWLSQVNLLLAAFNLIPGFPLDGGRVLRAFLWRRSGDYISATRTASMVGRGVAYSFILGGVVMMFTVAPINGLWFALIGWFLENAASISYRQALARDRLRGLSALDVMTSAYPLVSPHISLRELVEHHILPGARYFLVGDEGRLVGIITFHDIKRVPRKRRDNAAVKEVMVPGEEVVAARADEDAAGILGRMDECDVNQMPVLEEGRVVGVVTRKDILHFMQTRSGPAGDPGRKPP